MTAICAARAGVARIEHNLAPGSRGDAGQRRAPRAGADHGDRLRRGIVPLNPSPGARNARRPLLASGARFEDACGAFCFA